MNTLEQKADRFIQISSYFQIIRNHGILYFTGSYFLKTMTWLDIDLQLGLEEIKNAKDVLSQISASLIQEKGLKKLQFIDFLNYPRPRMTSGLCLNFIAFDEEIQDFWKVDLWILESSLLEENQKLMARFKEAMTPAHYTLIMNYKQEWTALYGRPPQMASYYLYQAIILKNLKERQEIETYLLSKGVKI